MEKDGEVINRKYGLRLRMFII